MTDTEEDQSIFTFLTGMWFISGKIISSAEVLVLNKCSKLIEMYINIFGGEDRKRAVEILRSYGILVKIKNFKKCPMENTALARIIGSLSLVVFRK